ncbi:MAG: Hsp70 family protein [Myxococcales bacterium]|nr:Hsp70 family protein [Myxococcales bacterium]
MSERRRHPRLPTTARVWWAPIDEDAVQLDRIRDISASGAWIETESLAHRGSLLDVTLVTDDEVELASGTARVIWSDPIRGLGIEFVDLSISPAKVANAAPPPVPGAARQVPPMPVRPRSEGPAPLVEVLSAPTKGVVIGLDLGTTNTCASVVRDGRPVIIPGRSGTTTIPSMVYFDAEGQAHVGQRAAARHVLEPTRTVYGSKRLLGRTYRERLARELQAHFAYPLGEAEDQHFGVRIDDFVIGMDVIATKVLQEVVASASEFLGEPVEGAVITVPAYFNEAQREAVRRAGAAAGITVHRLVSEPTAAAVAYGHRRDTKARVAVWDFGGGTFDISIVEIDREEYTVIATGGDNFLGGNDLDDQLASYLWETFVRDARMPSFDPTPQQVARLREAAEHAKRTLSVEREHWVHLRDMTEEPRRDLHVLVTRQELEQLIRPWLERSVALARDVLRLAGLTTSDVDDVLLVGGSTRVPAVHAAVAELFGRPPSRRINPDEAVAIGAALLAGELGHADGPALRDVLPMTIFHASGAARYEPLVRRNTRVPIEVRRDLRCDDLGVAQLPLFQGDSGEPASDEYLGTVVVTTPTPDEPVAVTLAFDGHGVMTIEARSRASGRGLSVDLDRARPWGQVLAELGLEDVVPSPAARAPASKVGAFFGRLFRRR